MNKNADGEEKLDYFTQLLYMRTFNYSKYLSVMSESLKKDGNPAYKEFSDKLKEKK